MKPLTHNKNRVAFTLLFLLLGLQVSVHWISGEHTGLAGQAELASSSSMNDCTIRTINLPNNKTQNEMVCDVSVEYKAKKAKKDSDETEAWNEHKRLIIREEKVDGRSAAERLTSPNPQGDSHLTSKWAVEVEGECQAGCNDYDFTDKTFTDINEAFKTALKEIEATAKTNYEEKKIAEKEKEEKDELKEKYENCEITLKSKYKDEDFDDLLEDEDLSLKDIKKRIVKVSNNSLSELSCNAKRIDHMDDDEARKLYSRKMAPLIRRMMEGSEPERRVAMQLVQELEGEVSDPSIHASLQAAGYYYHYRSKSDQLAKSYSQIRNSLDKLDMRNPQHQMAADSLHLQLSDIKGQYQNLARDSQQRFGYLASHYAYNSQENEYDYAAFNSGLQDISLWNDSLTNVFTTALNDPRNLLKMPSLQGRPVIDSDIIAGMDDYGSIITSRNRLSSTSLTNPSVFGNYDPPTGLRTYTPVSSGRSFNRPDRI